MLVSLNRLLGYTLIANDKEIGECEDFVFNDAEWTVPYAVAKTESHSDATTLVDTQLFDKPAWAIDALPVNADSWNLPTQVRADSELKSLKDMKHYQLKGVDSNGGSIEDIIIALPEWKVQYLIVDRHAYMPFGGRSMVHVEDTNGVDHANKLVYSPLSRTELRELPKYAPEALVTPDNRFILNEIYGWGSPVDRFIAKVRSVL